MDRSNEIKLINECIENRDNRTTSLGDTIHTSRADRYTSSERFELERDYLLKKLPMPLAHVSEVAEPNSYRRVDTPIGQLLVTRDEQGNSHVFHNSCRHRGARLINDDKGCSKRLTCPYHAWSYGTDGQLNTVPGEKHCFPDLDKQSHGLVEVANVEKYGFVWACPSATDTQSAEQALDDHLGEMGKDLQWMAGENLKAFKNTTKIWGGNWKLFAEGGLETYHFAFAHRNTIAPHFYNNTAVIENAGNHYRVIMPTRSLEKVEDTPEEHRSIHDFTHTLFMLMPYSAFLVQKEHVEWITFLPLSEGETRISITSLVPGDADLEDFQQRNHWDKNHQITITTLDEDWELGASIQDSLASGALEEIVYGKNEWALKDFNNKLDALIEQNQSA
ncbi:MAG: hypothetical protein AseanaTS_16530 [Candidatus Pelagadaptatus aseana]|uniref:aromatic ring-hydroxylating oxygenase subunit alpha n=1 Tax=Candidatus Pelagadaptatus aseana TaxID=3120508 RepID=UPI0039B247F1